MPVGTYALLIVDGFKKGENRLVNSFEWQDIMAGYYNYNNYLQIQSLIYFSLFIILLLENKSPPPPTNYSVLEDLYPT